MENAIETFRPAILKNMIAGAVACFFGAIWISIWLAGNGGIIGFLILAPIIFFIGIILWYLRISTVWIEAREEGLFIQSGIIAKKRSLLLYSQIQDINERQSLLERILGTKVLSIVTMTSLSAQTMQWMPSFETTDADRLKKMVLEKVERTKTVSSTSGKKTAGLEKELGENPFTFQMDKAILSAVSGIIFIAAIAIIGLVCLAVIVPLEIIIGFFFMLIPMMAIVIIFAVIGTAITLICTKYSLEKNQLEIKFEFFSMQKMTIPYDKIQDIIIRRLLPERIFGISSLKIETGAFDLMYSANYSAQNSKYQRPLNIIPALLEKDAIELRNILAKTINCSLEERKTALVAEMPLESIKPLKKTSAIALPIIVIFAIIAAFLPGYLLLLLGGIFLIAIIIYGYEILYLKNYYYNVSENALIIRKGVFVTREIIIPFDRIQNVFVDQDILDKIFGLWDTHVSTVTPHSEMHGHIDGLNQENAKKIADLLLEKMKQK